MHVAHEILVPLPGIEHVPPAVEAQSSITGRGTKISCATCMPPLLKQCTNAHFLVLNSVPWLHKMLILGETR